jgi:hypothetical protein
MIKKNTRTTTTTTEGSISSDRETYFSISRIQSVKEH